MMSNNLTRQDYVLAALASRPGAIFAPVQVQKLFFLLDERISGITGGKKFSFEPYDYGPFDKNVYRDLDLLSSQGLIAVWNPGTNQRKYALTALGQQIGEQKLQLIPEPARGFIGQVSDWVRSLSFAELVGSIYQAFPHMRVNSIFVDRE